MSLREEIAEALLYNSSSSSDEPRFKCSEIKDGFQLEFGAMYESPVVINFKTLSALSRLVGTEDINVDDFNYGGCESCDWGSDYGHTIDILNPTLRLDELKELSK